VSGVFTADPRVVPEARKLARISFDEMLEMAATGGKVLALRSVEFARNYNVPVHVRSSFTWEPGTWVTEEESGMEDAIISGVTHDIPAKIAIAQVADRPGRRIVVPRRRRVGQRRHDRAERIYQGSHGHLLHRAARRPAPRLGGGGEGRRRDRGHRRRP
jgi:hypothetical protein